MKSARQILLGGMLAAAVLALAPFAQAQQITGTPGSPDATVTIDGKQLPPPPMKFGGVITRIDPFRARAREGRACHSTKSRVEPELCVACCRRAASDCRKTSQWL
jgi:hypothetical protein